MDGVDLVSISAWTETVHTETDSISYGEEQQMGGGGGRDRQTDRDRDRHRERDRQKQRQRQQRGRGKETRERQGHRKGDLEQTQDRPKTGSMRWLQKSRARMTNLHTQILSQLTCLSCPFCEDPSPLLPWPPVAAGAELGGSSRAVLPGFVPLADTVAVWMTVAIWLTVAVWLAAAVWLAVAKLFSAVVCPWGWLTWAVWKGISPLLVPSGRKRMYWWGFVITDCVHRHNFMHHGVESRRSVHATVNNTENCTTHRIAHWLCLSSCLDWHQNQSLKVMTIFSSITLPKATLVYHNDCSTCSVMFHHNILSCHKAG